MITFYIIFFIIFHMWLNVFRGASNQMGHYVKVNLSIRPAYIYISIVLFFISLIPFYFFIGFEPTSIVILTLAYTLWAQLPWGFLLWLGRPNNIQRKLSILESTLLKIFSPQLALNMRMLLPPLLIVSCHFIFSILYK